MQFSNKPVLQLQSIIGKRLVVIQMPELVIEITFILIISNLNHLIYNPERFSVIYTNLMMMDLHRPIFDLLAIKKLHPVFA